MKSYGLLLMLVALAACEPKYTSGKTQCSDMYECPSGYTCAIATMLCMADGSGNGGAGGTSLRLDAAAGGAGGLKTNGVGGQSGLGGAIRDASPDSYSKDALSTCATPCPVNTQCLSGQCCSPPAAGGVCNPYPSCGCPTGKICYPSADTNAMACFVGNGLAAGADCSGGSSCKAGYGCFGGICKAYCNTKADCAQVQGIANCDQTTWSSDSANPSTPIAGLQVCAWICDPAHPQAGKSPLLPCPTGFNCSSDSAGFSYCLKASPLPTGSTCTTEGDCQPGYYCSTSSVCKRYCLSDTDCPTGQGCHFTFNPLQYAATYAVGYCGTSS
jgi:hypothetical protein